MVSMQQQEEDTRNNMELDNSGVTGTTGVKGLEDHIFTQDINQALHDCFGYQLEGLVKYNDKIQDEVLILVNRFENIATDRDEESDGDMDPYDGATAIFDAFGERYPTDYFGDDTVHATLRFLAKWVLFSRDVIKRCREIGFKNDAWVNLALDHFQNGRHDT